MVSCDTTAFAGLSWKQHTETPKAVLHIVRRERIQHIGLGYALATSCGTEGLSC